MLFGVFRVEPPTTRPVLPKTVDAQCSAAKVLLVMRSENCSCFPRHSHIRSATAFAH